MSNKTIYDGPTVSVTGGTAATFVLAPDPSTSKARWINSSEPDFEKRETIFATNRPARMGSDGSYVPQKVALALTRPIVDATTGEVRYNTVRIELTIHPQDGSELDNLRDSGVQLLSSADWDNLFNYGVLD